MTIIVIAVIETAFTSHGVMLGVIPTVLLFTGGMFCARKICEMIDDK